MVDKGPKANFPSLKCNPVQRMFARFVRNKVTIWRWQCTVFLQSSLLDMDANGTDQCVRII